MDIATLGLEIRSDGVVVAKDRLKDFEGQAGKAEVRAAALQKATLWMAGIAAVGITALGAGIGAAVLRMDQMAKMSRQLDQALRNTGNTARTSASEVEQFADRLERSTGRAAEEIMAVATNLATFGFNRQVYFEAIELADDMAAAWGGDLRQNVEGLARALAEPEKGLAMLTKRGITFTDQQKAMIAEFMKANDLLGAQGVILDTLQEQVSGVAEAGFGGLVKATANANKGMEDFFEALATTTNASGILEAVLVSATALMAGMAANTDIVIGVLAGLGAILFTVMIPALQVATVAAWGFAAAMLANPLTWVALAVGVVVAAIVILIQRMGGVEEAFLTVRTVAQNVWERIAAGGQSLAAYMAGVAASIAGSFASAWADVLQGFIGLMNSIAGAGNPLSMAAADGWISTKTSANSFADTAAAKHAEGAALWDKATGPAAPVDNVGLGASWEKMQSTFKSTKVAAVELNSAISGPTGLGAGAGAANDNVSKLADDGMTKLEDKTFKVAEGMKSALQGLGSGLFNALKQGGDVAGGVLDMLMGKLEQFASSWLDNVVNNGIDALFSGMGSFGIGSGMAGTSSITGSSGGYFPGFANGTNSAPGGMAWVGERGPELVNLPRGSQVFDSKRSMSMAANQNQRPQVSVSTNIINNAGIEVTQSTVEDGQGGIRQDIVLNRAVAGAISNPGPANKAARTVGQRVRR